MIRSMQRGAVGVITFFAIFVGCGSGGEESAGDAEPTRTATAGAEPARTATVDAEAGPVAKLPTLSPSAPGDLSELVDRWTDYVGDMAEVLPHIQTPEDARRHADDFARGLLTLRGWGEDLTADEDPLVLARAFSTAGSDFALANAAVAGEMMRIQMEPELFEAFRPAIEAYMQR